MLDSFVVKTYGCAVIGVDLSTNMVSIAYERLMGITESNLKVSVIGSLPSSSVLNAVCLGLLRNRRYHASRIRTQFIRRHL